MQNNKAFTFTAFYSSTFRNDEALKYMKFPCNRNTGLGTHSLEFIHELANEHRISGTLQLVKFFFFGKAEGTTIKYGTFCMLSTCASSSVVLVWAWLRDVLRFWISCAEACCASICTSSTCAGLPADSATI